MEITIDWFSYMLKFASSLLLIFLAGSSFADSYEDCLLENLKGVSSDYAAKKINESCEKKYGDSVKAKPSTKTEMDFLELEMNGGLFSSSNPKYKMPVPKGKWKKVAENDFTSRGGTPMSVQIFANVKNKKIKNLAVFEYSKQFSTNGNWSDKFCNRTNLHFIENYVSRGDFRLDCVGVNHFRVIGGKSNKVRNQAKKWARKKGIYIPSTMILHEHVISNNNYLKALIFYNPEFDGFPPTVDSSWSSNDWHQDKIIGDEKRQEYIERMINKAKEFHPKYKSEFDKYD